MQYQCLDCGTIQEEMQLIFFVNPEGKEVLKCRKCRGKVKPVEKPNKNEKAIP